MASPGELIDATANELGVPRARVFSAHRYLREAGIVTKGGRGTSAAKMTPHDAAVLLIAVTITQEVKDSAKTVREYAALITDSPLEFGDVVRGKTFGGALAALLEAVPADRDAFSGYDADWVTVSLLGPKPRATIEIGRRGRERPDTREYAKPRKRRDYPPFADLSFSASFTQVTLGHVGELVRAAAKTRG